MRVQAAQTEAKPPQDSQPGGNASAARSFENDRPSGVRCSNVQFLSVSHEPLALKKVSFTRQYLKANPLHPSMAIVNFGPVVRDRITDKRGHLAVPELQPGTYMIVMQGVEKPAYGTLEIYPKWASQICSQIFVVEDQGSWFEIHALR